LLSGVILHVVREIVKQLIPATWQADLESLLPDKIPEYGWGQTVQNF
jgi:hypothetical protein